MSEYDPIALDEQARAILRGNDRGGYTVPTAGLYPYQWNWDSAFAAWGFATFDLDRAWVEIETLLAGQWPNGMVPHILFHKPDPGYFPGPDVWGTEGIGPISSSGITQPPIAATFLRSIYERDRSASADRLRPLLPKLLAWHRWFMDWRSEDGVVFIIHPWESGRDNAPDWDTAMAAIDPSGVGEYQRRDTSHVDPEMRPTKDDYDRYIKLVQAGRAAGWDDAEMARNPLFRVGDPTLTFSLLRANRDLMEMMGAMGEDTDEVEGWIDRLEAGSERLLAPRGFYEAVDLLSSARSGEITNASFLAWYAGLEAEPLLDLLTEAFDASPFPVPSLDVTSSRFSGRRYWRGPTWAIMNALIGRGLHDMGHEAEAEGLRLATRGLIANHGFAEYFDPFTGAPAGGGSFTWTAAVWLAWASPSVEVG